MALTIHRFFKLKDGTCMWLNGLGVVKPGQEAGSTTALGGGQGWPPRISSMTYRYRLCQRNWIDTLILWYPAGVSNFDICSATAEKTLYKNNGALFSRITQLPDTIPRRFLKRRKKQVSSKLGVLASPRHSSTELAKLAAKN